LKRKYSKFKNLSSGLKQRLALASVLLGDPEVLVLDEPTKSLDPEGFSDLRNIIHQQAREGKTIILASHILDEVEKVCTHVGILKSGELIREGKVKDILGSSELYFIDANDRENLSKILSDAEIVKEYEQSEQGIKVFLKRGYDSKDLNQLIFDKGEVLSKLEIMKNTLEKEFLQLIK
jgi:ABC-2 type transport system ATP-binding protein